jgi:hypothetical protein
MNWFFYAAADQGYGLGRKSKIFYTLENKKNYQYLISIYEYDAISCEETFSEMQCEVRVKNRTNLGRKSALDLWLMNPPNQYPPLLTV